MKKYLLLVDSSCDIPESFIEGREIKVTNLVINFGERVYFDRKDITSEEILKIYEEKKIFPKTSALNIADLTEIFERYLKEYEHIFYMPISSEISSIFNNARLAASELDANRITVLDSMSLSSGTGLEAIGILRDFDKKLSPEQIEKNHYERCQRVQMQFVIDTMDFLYKGGRCSGMTFFIGSTFHLHPIVKLEDKKMGVKKVVRGKNIEKGVKEMCEKLLEELDKSNIDLDYPILIPNVISPDGVDRVKHELEKRLGDKILFPVDASGIICCHCGANTCGIAYMTKNPIK